MKYCPTPKDLPTNHKNPPQEVTEEKDDEEDSYMSEIEFSSERWECPYRINMSSVRSTSFREIGFDGSFFQGLDEESGEVFTVPLSPPTGGKDLSKMVDTENLHCCGMNYTSTQKSTTSNSETKIGRLDATTPRQQRYQKKRVPGTTDDTCNYMRRDPFAQENSPNSTFLDSMSEKLRSPEKCNFSSEVSYSLSALSKLSGLSRLATSGGRVGGECVSGGSALVAKGRAGCFGRFQENSGNMRYRCNSMQFPNGMQDPVRATFVSAAGSHTSTNPPPIHPPPSLKNLNVRKKRQRAILPITLTASIQNELARILEKLMKHRWSFVFDRPVDVVALNIPDYFDIIKHPMDLTTVQNKLRSPGTYRTVGDFCSDVNLVWTNALIYNPKGNDVHIMAQTLQKYFHRLIKHLDQSQTLYSQLPQTTLNQSTQPTNMSLPHLHNQNNGRMKPFQHNVALSNQQTYAQPSVERHKVFNSIPSLVKDNYLQRRLMWGRHGAPNNVIAATPVNAIQINPQKAKNSCLSYAG